MSLILWILFDAGISRPLIIDVLLGSDFRFGSMPV